MCFVSVWETEKYAFKSELKKKSLLLKLYYASIKINICIKKRKGGGERGRMKEWKPCSTFKANFLYLNSGILTFKKQIEFQGTAAIMDVVSKLDKISCTSYGFDC